MTQMNRAAGWRTVDIVVASVIAVAFGVVSGFTVTGACQVRWTEADTSA